MFCPYCGKEVGEKAAVCLGCGRSVQSVSKVTYQDSASVGWWWLGFFFPLIGFILWCVWTGNTPMRARKVGWGSLTGAIVSVVSVVLLYVLVFVLTIIFAMQF